MTATTVTISALTSEELAAIAFSDPAIKFGDISLDMWETALGLDTPAPFSGSIKIDESKQAYLKKFKSMPAVDLEDCWNAALSYPLAMRVDQYHRLIMQWRIEPGTSVTYTEDFDYQDRKTQAHLKRISA